jgi:hypothetical protein
MSRNAFYSAKLKIIPLPYRLLRVLSARSVSLPLADHRDLTGTSQPITRGTLLPP